MASDSMTQEWHYYDEIKKNCDAFLFVIYLDEELVEPTEKD
ncbi:hypothetical protein [Listeria monocytogenes]